MITAIVVSVIVGILAGYVTSARTPSDGIEDLTRNMVVGIAGAFVGLQVVSRAFDSGESGTSTLALIVAGIAGAGLLLLVVNRVRRA